MLSDRRYTDKAFKVLVNLRSSNSIPGILQCIHTRVVAQERYMEYQYRVNHIDTRYISPLSSAFSCISIERI